MKKQVLFLLLISLKISAQNGGYFREWATFIGPVGGMGGLKVINNQLAVSSETIETLGTLPANTSYYNQFATLGAAGINPASSMNVLYERYSSSGSLLNSYYSTKYDYNDEWNNFYNVDAVSNAAILPYNTWMPTNPYPPSNTVVLTKYDASHNLLWKTYLPTTLVNFLAFDENKNIFIEGATQKQDISTLGTWQSNFVTDYNGGQIRPNNFLAKLSPDGQLLWCTYLPVRDVTSIDVKNNTVALASLSDFLTTDTSLATTGAFCVQKRGIAISSLNAINGQRNWGTYYGDTNTYAVGREIKITPSSILLMGYEVNGQGYFATEGAMKSTNHIDDNFITRFSLDGSQRIWSTYLGTNGDEAYDAGLGFDGMSQQMSYRNGKILYLGESNNGTNNIATPGAYQTTPANIYVTMLDETKGDEIFTTYYGPQTTGTYQLNHSWSAFSKDEDSFYISGSSKNPNNIASIGAVYPTIYPIPEPGLYPQPSTGFVAKFTYDPTMLTTAEVSQREDLALYDNPNNGHFSIRGNILAKESCTATVYDASGKMVLSIKLPKSTVAEVTLPAGSPSGTYMVSVSSVKKVVKTFKMVVGK